MESVTRSYTYSEAARKIEETDYSSLAGRVSSHDPGNDQWGGAPWARAYDLFLDGWPEAVPQIDVKARGKLHARLRPSPMWGVDGSDVDMLAYLSGTPENMVEVVRSMRPSPVVKIGIDLATSAHVQPEDMMRLGKQTLIVVESLRLAGIPAEVWAVEAVTGKARGAGTSVYEIRVQVQTPDKPIDVSRLAFWVAHPAALRRILFALEETESVGVRRTFGFGMNPDGYGIPKAGHSRHEFDEWAPSPGSPQARVEAWVSDILTRRIGG